MIQKSWQQSLIKSNLGVNAEVKRKVHVIHHTHWDFEWYFTANESLVQLAYHLDEVMQALEQQQISYYLLDGQMSILDDYLTSFPEQKERLMK